MFKFVDDQLALKIGDLLVTKISTYDLKEYIPSDIPLFNIYIKNKTFNSPTTSS